MLPVLNIWEVGAVYATLDSKAMASSVNRMVHVLAYSAVSMPNVYLPLITRETACVTMDIKAMDRLVLRVTNVKGSRVELTLLVTPLENVPVIKVSKEMGGYVRMSTNVKKACINVILTQTVRTLWARIHVVVSKVILGMD